jgi:hypothetical protein
MSLTSLIKNADVSAYFKSQFPRPALSRKMKPLAPPLTSNHSLVGTAFDYLLRFYIGRLYPRALTSPWVAENVPAKLHDFIQLAEDQCIYGKWLRLRRSRFDRYDLSYVAYTKRRHEKALEIISEAKIAQARYLKSGKINYGLLKSVLLLAQLDPLYRSGASEYKLGLIDRRDVQDLEALIGLVTPIHFKPKKRAVLNPTFGAGTRLVGGADADLILDDTILEIKTTKTLELRQATYNQLIGYYILSVIGGVDGIGYQFVARKLGIYFSRFGEIHTFDIKDVVDPRKLKSFVRWFIDRAKQEELLQLF